MVESLKYAMIGIRPSITYAISHVNRFMSNLRKEHWNATKW